MKSWRRSKTDDGEQFTTMTVDICLQRGGREALRRAGLSAAAGTGLIVQLTLGLYSVKLREMPIGRAARDYR